MTEENDIRRQETIRTVLCRLCGEVINIGYGRITCHECNGERITFRRDDGVGSTDPLAASVERDFFPPEDSPERPTAPDLRSIVDFLILGSGGLRAYEYHELVAWKTSDPYIVAAEWTVACLARAENQDLLGAIVEQAMFDQVEQDNTPGTPGGKG